jgi:hypothetical protein
MTEAGDSIQVVAPQSGSIFISTMLAQFKNPQKAGLFAITIQITDKDISASQEQ